MTNRIVLPRIMQTGAGASKDIPQILATLGCSRPLIITDKMMENDNTSTMYLSIFLLCGLCELVLIIVKHKYVACDRQNTNYQHSKCASGAHQKRIKQLIS